MAVIFGLMWQFGGPALSVSILMALLAAIGSVICVKLAPAAIAATGKDDPREVVADELAGQAVTFLAVPLAIAETLTTGQIWMIAGAGFVLFRLFDITKPWPIRKLEKLPQGWGVLADDLLAGVYAAIGLFICIRFWICSPTGPAA
jgi:phosphatidylglycerophosphatase A